MMFEPTTLPTASSGSFFNAAIMDVASSGREVPTAMTVSPMRASDTPRADARPTAPVTASFPPAASRPSPAKTMMPPMDMLSFGRDGMCSSPWTRYSSSLLLRSASFTL